MPWVLANLRSIAVAASVLAVLAAGWLIVDRIRDSGRREIISEITTQNQGAADAATRARTDHDAACARERPDCLQDGWTRDRGR